MSRLSLLRISLPFALVLISSCGPAKNAQAIFPTRPADPASLTEADKALDPEVDFIVGGVRVSGKSDFIARSTVALVARAGEGMAICSGTLIAPDVILTAGHCVESGARNMRAVFSRSLSHAADHVIDVDAVARPANYAIGKSGHEDRDLNDIALVKLAAAAPSTYETAELASQDLELKDHEKLILAGYGIVHGESSNTKGMNGAGTLRKVVVQIEQAHYGKTEILIDQENGKGACHGDSGGPAYVHSNGKAIVVGITSRGLSNEPDDCVHHSVYTSVSAHSDWIEKTMTQLRSR